MKSLKLVPGIQIFALCLIVLAATAATANFDNRPNNQQVLGNSALTLRVKHHSTNAGVVTSSPAGINCGEDCSEVFSEGQSVTLTRSTDDPNAVFSLWSSSVACNEGFTAETCTVTIPSEGLTVTAIWKYKTYNYKVIKSGSGSGTVTGSGINCGDTCSATGSGDGINEITAVASDDSKFVGWQSEGTICKQVSGLGGDSFNIAYNGSEVNTSPTCKWQFDTANDLVAIAKFDLINPVATEEADKQEDSAQKPDTPTAKVKNSSGFEVESTADKPIVFEENNPISITGSTVANGIVKLYIFSEPQEGQVTADQDGAWSYTIEEIEPGDHRVEIEVTDPATGATSEREEVLAFQVAQGSTPEASAAEPIVEQADDSSSSNTVFIIGGILILLILGGVIWFVIHKRNSKSSAFASPDEVSQPTYNEIPPEDFSQQ